ALPLENVPRSLAIPGSTDQAVPAAQAAGGSAGGRCRRAARRNRSGQTQAEKTTAPARAPAEGIGTVEGLKRARPGAMPTPLPGHAGEPCPRKGVGMAPTAFCLAIGFAMLPFLAAGEAPPAKKELQTFTGKVVPLSA